MYLAYIRSVPKDLIDAARVDGATTFKIYRHVYFPMLSAAHFMLMSFMTTFVLFGIFDIVWVMTAGGPAYSSHVLATFMVALAWNRTLYGYGAAAAEVLLAMCSGLIAYYMIKALK
jgi:raffinose/stachyose/melibiose transport system permease protein